MSESRTNRIERAITIDAPPARVWRAISDHREFGTWFRVSLEGPFVPGQSVKGRITYPGYEHVVMDVRVCTVAPPTLLSFYWHPHAVDPAVDYSHEPPTLVEFRVEAAGSGTRVTVTESGFDAIPASRRAEAFRMNSGGWDIQVENIRAYVAANL